MNCRIAASCLPAVLTALLLVGGCASGGPKHAEIRESLGQPDQGMGRIYFYRDRNIVGAAIQPVIRLNGEAVGNSTPGGFFFVDRPQGQYVAAVATETVNTVEFTLAAGETRYVRTYVSLGILIGRAYPELVVPEQAIAELADLDHIGDPSMIAKRSAPGSSPSSRTGVTMDELQGLLPEAGTGARPARPGDTRLDDLQRLLPAGSKP